MLSPSARKRLIVVSAFILCVVVAAAVSFGSVTGANTEEPMVFDPSATITVNDTTDTSTNGKAAPSGLLFAYVVNSNIDAVAVNLVTGETATPGQITLRSAIQAATAQPGSHTITFSGAVVSPINLTLGQITVGNAANGNNITISGPGMNSLTVNQTTENRIFSTGTGAVTFLLQNITLNYTGPAVTAYSGGGGAIIAGGAGAATTLINCRISNFQRQIGNGGAISASSSLANHSLTITNSIFTNNRAGGGGGAVSFNSQGGTATITGNTFDNNHTGPVGANTGGDGGAVNLSGGGSGGTYLIERNTFLNNQVENVTGHAGAIMSTNGTATIRYNRFRGNTCANVAFPPLANIIGQAGGATTHVTIANDNWWGVNTGPGANDATALAAGAVMTLTQWLQLRHSGSPSAVLLGGTSALTADILGRNSGGPTAAGNLTGLPAFPSPAATIFGNPQKGTLSAASTQFINGQATATFTAGIVSASCGTGGADATADSQTVNGPVIVQCPDLTAAKTNNVANAAVVGQTWTWTITVTNGGNAAGTFPTSSTILSDNLPNSANISYGTPTPSIAGVNCTINGTKDLICTATSPVTLAAGGGNFNVQFTAVASPPGTAVGTYANPRGGGTASVDPNDAMVESNEGNNTFSNSVVVSKANTSLSSITDSPDPSVVGQPYTVGFTLNVTAPGSGTRTGTVTVNDGTGGSCVATLPATSCSITSTTAGVKTLTVTYSGDDNFNGSNTTVGHLVNKASTTTTITNAVALATATVVGQSYPVTWSVTVNLPGSVGAALTGNVTVSDGSQICSAAVSALTCNLTSTTPGAKTITATYAGDANYNASPTSPGIAHTVNKADTTVALGTSGTPSVFGQLVTLTATITVTLPGAGSPTGNMTFKDNSVDIGTCTAQTVAANVATCAISTFSVATHPITAIYNGDTNFNVSPASSILNQVVNKANTTTGVISSQNPSLTGQPVTFTATLAVTAPGAGTPTGTVDFLDGMTVITGCDDVALTGLTAQCMTSALTAASHTITATYGGDGSFNASPAGSMTGNPQVVSNTAVWDGSASTDWNTAANWTTNFVPLATHNVDLPTGALPNQPNLSAGDTTVVNLAVGANRTLTIGGGRTLSVTGVLTMNGNNIDATAGTLEIGGAGTVVRTSGVVLGNMRKIVTSAPIAPEAPAFVFVYPVGTSTGFSPLSANFTAGSGSLTVAAINGTAPSTPALSDATTLDRYWQLTEAGTITASLTFTYLQADVDGVETNYRLIRSSAGAPPIRFPNGAPCPGAGSPCVDGTSAAGGTIFVNPVQSFDNFWTAGEPVAPTNASVTVSGRVFNSEGQALVRAIVTMTDSNGNTRQAITNLLGYYRFTEVESGRDYVFMIASKGYTFQPSVVAVNDNFDDLDFIASP